MRSKQLGVYVSTIVNIFILLPALIACGRANQAGNAPLDSNALATAAVRTLQAQSALLTAQAGG